MNALFQHLRKANRLDVHADAPRLWRRTARTICTIVFVLLCGANVVSATTFGAYHQRVHLSAIMLEALPQWKKVESQANYNLRAEAAVQELRETLLPIQVVEWNGTTLSVDNKWLAEALARFEQIPASDDARRTHELARMAERLKALDERFTELGGQAGGASKDEEKKKLDAILQRSEYSEKVNEGSALARLWRRFRQWLRDLLPRGEALQPGESSLLSKIAQILVIALAVAVIVYILWKFAPMFRRSRAGGGKAKSEARVILGERLEPDQTSADLLAEAEALARAGDLRAAIRKGYIALLCELGDRKIIGLAQHKTNRDYLRAVSRIEPLHQQMQQLTQSFENHWYGFVPATETDWNAFRSGFQRIAGNE